MSHFFQFKVIKIVSNLFSHVKLMMDCWAEKPDKRPSFETLRQVLDDFDDFFCVPYDR